MATLPPDEILKAILSRQRHHGAVPLGESPTKPAYVKQYENLASCKSAIDPACLPSTRLRKSEHDMLEKGPPGSILKAVSLRGKR